MMKLVGRLSTLVILALYEECWSLAPLPVLYDSSNKLHRNIHYHPEQPARINACVEALTKFDASENGRIELVDMSPTSSSGGFSEEELNHARDMLIEAHTEDLVLGLEERCRRSRQRRIDDGKDPLGFVGYVDDDTYVTTESYDVCLRATATWIRAIDTAMASDGISAAMALTRPPGHHATKLMPNGFCLFNFAAAATIHALKKYPDIKVSVLDWDVHFGQGVADILQKHPRARYVSIHQLQAFPYQGETKKVGGENSNVYTIPIRPETTWACGYEDVFLNDALPFVRASDGSWEPDLVIVCSGYDALDSDELASVSLQASDYGHMTRKLVEHVGRNRVKPPGLMLGLEGGYQLNEFAGGGNLPDAVIETVKSLLNNGEGDKQ